MLVRLASSVCALAILTLTGCGSFIENVESIEKVAGALSFQADPRSGDTADQRYKIALLGDSDAGRAKQLKRGDFGDNPKLQRVIDVCEPPRVTHYAFPAVGNIAGFVGSVGQLLFDRVFADIQGRIDALKSRGTASYSIRRAWDASSGIRWHDVNCIVIVRELTAAAHAKEKASADSKSAGGPIRMVTVFQRRKLLSNKRTASILAPVYVKVDRSVAETALATQAKKATIRLNVGIAMTALYSSKAGKAAVTEIYSIPFKPITAPLGEVAKTCDLWEPGVNQLDAGICDSASTLILDPPPGAAFDMRIVITETGTAVTEAEAATKALEALKKAAQPLATDLIKQVSARF